MAEYVLKKEGKFNSIGSVVTNLELEFPNLSNIRNNIDSYADVVIVTPRPETLELETAVRDGIELIDGKYYQKWKVQAMFSDYVDEEGVTITKEEQETKYLSELEDRRIKNLKLEARQSIRDIVDLDDDLVNTKRSLQFLIRGFVSMWDSLPQEQKDVNPYKNNLDTFSNLIKTTLLRIDLDGDSTAQATKITEVLNLESIFSQIVNNEYLSKI
jgi:hypothetical protein